MPEITLSDKFGRTIAWAVKKFRLAINLEIGSWDGTGSTSCFIAGMSRLESAGLRNLKLQCVEVNPEKFVLLKQSIRSCGYAEAFNMSSIGRRSFLPESFEEIWDSPYNMHRKEGSYARELVRSWYLGDVAGLPESGFLESSFALPLYDSVLIDGSEFTGYSEFRLLQKRSRVFFLDDVHHAYKCNQIYEELKTDPSWLMVAEDPQVRHGFAIFRRLR